MSLHTSARAATTSIRSLTTSAKRLADQSPPSSSSSSSSAPSPASTSGFKPLISLFASRQPSPLSGPPSHLSRLSQDHAHQLSSSGSIGGAPPRPQHARGYDIHALPPRIDPHIDLLTNMIMRDGRKAEAQKQVARMLRVLQGVTNQPPIPLVHQAIHLASPYVRILQQKGSSFNKNVPVPTPLTDRQRSHRAIAWILRAAEKGRNPLAKRETRIAREILALIEGESDVYKWIEERHKAAGLARGNVQSGHR